MGRKRGGENKRALCTTRISMTKFSVLELYFCLPSCIVLILDPCSLLLFGPDTLSEHTILEYDQLDSGIWRQSPWPF